MDFISRILFESPVWLGILSFIAFAIILFWRTRMESQTARRRAIPMTLVAIALLFLIQTVVETEREKILNQIDRFVTAIVNEQSIEAASIISPLYDSEDVDKDEFEESLKDWFEIIDVRDPRFARRDVTIDGDHAVMILGASATVSIHKETGTTHFAVFRIEWQRESDAWRMTRITPESINLQPITSLRQLRGMVGR
jgi:hypothetical protein